MSHLPQILFDRSANSFSYFEEELQSVEGVKGITFLIASGCPQSQDTINAFLQTISVPVSGGVFPEVIYEGKYFSDGMIAILWFDDIYVNTFENASDLSSPLHTQRTPILERGESETSLIISNTQTRAAEAALDSLYYRCGQSTQYTGGGSGYPLDRPAPSIVTNNGLVADSLQITCFPYKQQINVGHGWSVLSGPHLVTDSEENRVKTLDYQEIRPYYESVIKNSLGKEVEGVTFEEMINRYPIGIQPYDEDMIVRDILSYADTTMNFIGDIPVFSSVYILAGKPDYLLSYAKESADTFKQIVNDKPDLTIIFSCIGRRIYMGDKSGEELDILTDNLEGSRQVIGVASFGEIASNTTGLACLHSMSIVVTNLWT